MTTIVVNIDNLGTPWIEATSGGQINYDTIQQSIGQGYEFGLNQLYMKSTTIPQLLLPISLEKNNRRGIFELKQFIPIVDPYQFTSALFSDVLDKGQNESLVFNGMQNFVSTILPNETVFFQFSMQEISTNNLLPGRTNFEAMEYFDFLADFPERDGTSHTDRSLQINLSVKNNSAALGVPQNVKISLLGGAPDTYAQSANANNLWTWNGFTPGFSASTVTLNYKNAGAGSFQQITLNGSFDSIDSIVNSLNVNTSLGLFWYYVGGLGQYILATSNDTLDFGSLIYN